MLTTTDLLTNITVPNIRDVSLELYRDFSESYLIPRTFHYKFLDGTKIDVKFTEYGIYHMLCINKINNRIRNNRFFSEIRSGLSFATFEANRGMNARFKLCKRRITRFACIYQTLLDGRMFYLPSGHVRNTAEVEVDYIAYKKLNITSPSGVTSNGKG